MRARLPNAILAMLFAALAAWPAAAATVGERHLVAHEASAVAAQRLAQGRSPDHGLVSGRARRGRGAARHRPSRQADFHARLSGAERGFRGRPPAPGDPAVARLRRLRADHGVVRNGFGAAWLCRDRGRSPRQQRARPDDDRAAPSSSGSGRATSRRRSTRRKAIRRSAPISTSTGSARRASRPAASRPSSRLARAWISTAFCDSATPIRTTGSARRRKSFSSRAPTRKRSSLSPPARSALAHAKDDLSIPDVKAAFVMAPGIVQSLDPESLKRMRLPVAILLGDADKVAPPATNGEVAAALIPGAKLTVLPHVGHYDFLAECTPAGDAVVPVCPTESRAPRRIRPRSTTRWRCSTRRSGASSPSRFRLRAGAAS